MSNVSIKFQHERAKCFFFPTFPTSEVLRRTLGSRSKSNTHLFSYLDIPGWWVTSRSGKLVTDQNFLTIKKFSLSLFLVFSHHDGLLSFLDSYCSWECTQSVAPTGGNHGERLYSSSLTGQTLDEDIVFRCLLEVPSHCGGPLGIGPSVVAVEGLGAGWGGIRRRCVVGGVCLGLAGERVAIE